MCNFLIISVSRKTTHTRAQQPPHTMSMSRHRPSRYEYIVHVNNDCRQTVADTLYMAVFVHLCDDAGLIHMVVDRVAAFLSQYKSTGLIKCEDLEEAKVRKMYHEDIKRNHICIYSDEHIEMTDTEPSDKVVSFVEAMEKELAAKGY